MEPPHPPPGFSWRTRLRYLVFSTAALLLLLVAGPAERGAPWASQAAGWIYLVLILALVAKTQFFPRRPD